MWVRISVFLEYLFRKLFYMPSVYHASCFIFQQRKTLLKSTPIIMPIVTEQFDFEKYAHVDGMLANFQGVFLNDVRL